MTSLNITTDALVIKETSIKDNDRLVSLMTKDLGIINAFATGAKSIKSKRGSATGLLSYSNFTLNKKGDTYRVTEAVANRVFFGAGSDIITLSLSQYFCELAYNLYPQDTSSNEFFRLILNSLHFLTEKKMNYNLIKAITELRIAVLSGYTPDLVACNTCGKFEDDVMFFDYKNGSVYCNDCNASDSNIKISLDIVKALRHIVFSDFSNIYSFELSDKNAAILSETTEKYIIYQNERSFKTLDFYNSIKGAI